MNTAVYKLYEISMLINICACSFLVLIGFAGGFITLMVFWHAKGKPPKIGGQNYLTILTITNSLFLTFHWFINTSHLIIDYFDIRNGQAIFYLLNLVNYSNLTCKLMNFLSAAVRSMSTYLTLTFSLERTFATYFPFKMMHHKQNSNRIFKIVISMIISFSFFISVHDLVTYRLVKKQTDNDFVCDVPEQLESIHVILKFIFITITLGFPFSLITLSNIAIVLRMNKKNDVSVNQFYSINIRNTKNLKKLFNKSFGEKSVKSVNFSNIIIRKHKCSSLIKIDISNIDREKSCLKFLNSHCIILNKRTGQVSLYKELLKINEKARKLEISRQKKSQDDKIQKNFKVHCINQTFYKTKILIILTSFYVILNFPYFFIIVITFNPFVTITEQNLKRMESYDRFRFHAILLLSEILYICNYSISGFLLFFLWQNI